MSVFKQESIADTVSEELIETLSHALLKQPKCKSKERWRGTPHQHRSVLLDATTGCNNSLTPCTGRQRSSLRQTVKILNKDLIVLH